MNKSECERWVKAKDYVLPILLDINEDEWAPLSDLIGYGSEPPPDGAGSRFHIVASSLFSDETYGRQSSLPRLPLASFHGVPLLYGEPRIAEKGGRILSHADLVASSFFLLARYEELLPDTERDKFGRISGKASLAARGGFLSMPLVERYGNILRALLTEAGLGLPPRRRRKSRIVLTHDLDNHRLFHGFRSVAGQSLRFVRGDTSFHLLIKAVTCALGLTPDPLDTFSTIFSLADGLGKSLGHDRVASIHFIMAGGASRYDGLYELTDPAVSRTIDRIKETGAEVGLHVSYEAGDNDRLIQGEKARLEQKIGRPVVSSRHHYLHFIRPGHARTMGLNGLHDDYSLCYADTLGFRLGVTRPIPAFDAGAFERCPIVYHPTTLMDATLDNPAYLGASEQDAYWLAKAHVDEILSGGGELVLLWHNCRLRQDGPGYHQRLYPRIVGYLGEKQFAY